MKGLIRNNFYSMQGNVKISFFIAFILVFVPIVVPNSSVVPMIIAMQISVFIFNTGTSLHADEVANWNKFELTLPITRQTIITAKYLSFILLICCGLIMSIFTLSCATLIRMELNSASLIWGYQFGLTLSVTTIAIIYPAMLKFGTDKNELFLIISIFASIGIMLLIALALANITGGMNLRHPLVGMVSVSFSAVLFILSFLLSLKIHQNKEF